NRPFLVECKFSLGREHINLANLTNHIYKLAAINKRFGISAKSAIFTLSDLTSLSENARKGLVRRLAISGVSKIFDRNLINNNFASHLKEFLKQ
ncbi:MAG: hypothetical protein N2662_05110, partial [Bacteroidales bacterium]|nr:hypothetical protein [Bacteroidales bacterium]